MPRGTPKLHPGQHRGLRGGSGCTLDIDGPRGRTAVPSGGAGGTGAETDAVRSRIGDRCVGVRSRRSQAASAAVSAASATLTGASAIRHPRCQVSKPAHLCAPGMAPSRPRPLRYQSSARTACAEPGVRRHRAAARNGGWHGASERWLVLVRAPLQRSGAVVNGAAFGHERTRGRAWNGRQPRRLLRLAMMAQESSGAADSPRAPRAAPPGIGRTFALRRCIRAWDRGAWLYSAALPSTAQAHQASARALLGSKARTQLDPLRIQQPPTSRRLCGASRRRWYERDRTASAGKRSSVRMESS